MYIHVYSYVYIPVHIAIYIQTHVTVPTYAMHVNTHIFCSLRNYTKQKVYFCFCFFFFLSAAHYYFDSIGEGKVKKKKSLFSRIFFPVKVMGLRDCNFNPFNISAFLLPTGYHIFG